LFVNISANSYFDTLNTTSKLTLETASNRQQAATADSFAGWFLDKPLFFADLHSSFAVRSFSAAALCIFRVHQPLF
jgi:hypothetical protein